MRLALGIEKPPRPGQKVTLRVAGFTMAYDHDTSALPARFSILAPFGQGPKNGCDGSGWFSASGVVVPATGPIATTGHGRGVRRNIGLAG